MKQLYTWHTELDSAAFFRRLESQTHPDNVQQRSVSKNDNCFFLSRRSQGRFHLEFQRANAGLHIQRGLSARVTPTASGLEITGRVRMHPVMFSSSIVWLALLVLSFCMFLLDNPVLCIFPLLLALAMATLLLLTSGKPTQVLTLMDEICGQSHMRN